MRRLRDDLILRQDLMQEIWQLAQRRCPDAGGVQTRQAGTAIDREANVNLGMIADGSASSTNLMLEAGYRGGSLATGGVNFDWGGYLIRAGVNFAL